MLKVLNWNGFGFMVSFLLALVSVVLLDPYQVTIAFIVLGQGHFLLTYLYQWKAGKVGITYLSLYALALCALWAGFAFIPDPLSWSYLIAGTIFSIHFFVDEMHINKMALSLEQKLVGFAFVLMYSGLLFDALYAFEAPLLLSALAFVACLPLAIEKIRARSISGAEMFFFGSILVLAALLYSQISIHITLALGFIILFHYVRWYLFYFFRFIEEEGRSRFRRYLIDVGVTNALVIALFVGYFYLPQLAFLRFLFRPEYFFAWTILHVVFSIRISKRAPRPQS